MFIVFELLFLLCFETSDVTRFLLYHLSSGVKTQIGYEKKKKKYGANKLLDKIQYFKKKREKFGAEEIMKKKIKKI